MDDLEKVDDPALLRAVLRQFLAKWKEDKVEALSFTKNRAYVCECVCVCVCKLLSLVLPYC